MSKKKPTSSAPSSKTASAQVVQAPNVVGPQQAPQNGGPTASQSNAGAAESRPGSRTVRPKFKPGTRYRRPETPATTGGPITLSLEPPAAKGKFVSATLVATVGGRVQGVWSVGLAGLKPPAVGAAAPAKFTVPEWTSATRAQCLADCGAAPSPLVVTLALVWIADGKNGDVTQYFLEFAPARAGWKTDDDALAQNC